MDPRLPNLLVIGAMKAGTTSLHRHLDLHPEIGGVDPGFDSPHFERVHHPSARKRRATALGRLALRTLGPYQLNRLKRRAGFVDRIVREERVERPALSDTLRRRLEDRLRDEARALRDRTGLSFEGWSA